MTVSLSLTILAVVLLVFEGLVGLVRGMNCGVVTVFDDVVLLKILRHM